MTKADAGRLGGLATGRSQNKEFLTRRASKAGTTTIMRYGSEFYKHIRTINASSSKRGK